MFVDEVTRRWGAAGHAVTLISSANAGGRHEDLEAGVRIVRIGRLTGGTHHLLGPRYLRKGRGADVLLESINTIPYMLPLRRKGLPPFVPLVHQLARDVWFAELKKPLAVAAHAVEPVLYRPYRDVHMLAVSNSTRQDLFDAGVRSVSVIPQGGIGAQQPPDKASRPTFLFVGRLARNKRPAHALTAFSMIRERLPEARLWVIGTGQMESELARQGVDGAEFLGRVDRAELLQRMGQAHVLLATSVREGWGLVVTEANAMGTPAVAYDVPGLRDSVRDGETGALVHEDPAALADAAIDLLTRRETYERVRKNALAWGASQSWDSTATALLAHLKSAAGPASLRQDHP